MGNTRCENERLVWHDKNHLKNEEARNTRAAIFNVTHHTAPTNIENLAREVLEFVANRNFTDTAKTNLGLACSQIGKNLPQSAGSKETRMSRAQSISEFPQPSYDVSGNDTD